MNDVTLFYKDSALNKATHFRVIDEEIFYYKGLYIDGVVQVLDGERWTTCGNQNKDSWKYVLTPITYEVTTEGYVEGRSKAVGVFTGSKEQIIQYMFENKIPYTYNLYFKQVRAVDVTDCTVITHTLGKTGKYAPAPIKQEMTVEQKAKDVLLKLDEESNKVLSEYISLLQASKE